MKIQVLFLLLSSLSLAGCGGSPKGPTPTVGDLDSRLSPVGRWAQGRQEMRFTEDGRFSWVWPQPCALPPCQTRYLEGRYTIEGGNRLKLTPQEGPTQTLLFRVTPQPRQLRVRLLSGGQSAEVWRLDPA